MLGVSFEYNDAELLISSSKQWKNLIRPVGVFKNHIDHFLHYLTTYIPPVDILTKQAY